MTEPQSIGQDWTNEFSAWTAVDNGNGTQTWTREGSGDGTQACFAALSAGAAALVKRLVLGNWTKDGVRTARTTTTLTFRTDLTEAEASAVYVHQQPSRGMSS